MNTTSPHAPRLVGATLLTLLVFTVTGCGVAENFTAAREKAQANTCIDNLRQIEAVCEQLKMEGTEVSAKNIYGEDKYIKVELRCPSDPSKPYVIPTGDDRPVCPNADRFPEHVLPGIN